jgi:hypothetical protein
MQLPTAIAEHFKGCLIPQTSLDSWSKQHDLCLDPVNCPCCEKELEPILPFVTSTMRGLIFEQCTCEKYPKNQAPFLYGAADPSERQRDREFAQSLYEHI